MSNIFNKKNKNELMHQSEINKQFSSNGLYIKEDDQDWGSAGMNDIQETTSINH
jgi:hypothetical protein